MKLNEILEAANRLQEPEEEGIYHIYDNWFKKEPEHCAVIEVRHGPRGGYRRPRRYNLPRKNPQSEFYWRNGYIWLTEDEHESYIIDMNNF